VRRAEFTSLALCCAPWARNEVLEAEFGKNLCLVRKMKKVEQDCRQKVAKRSQDNCGVFVISSFDF
jgi:hypothetical protein